MAEKGSKTRVDRIWESIKNNRFVAGLIVAGAIVISVGQLTGALSDIMTFLNRWNSTETDTALSKPNVESGKSTDSSPCASNGGAAAIRAYALAFSDPDSLPEFVKENAMLFARDGNTTKCLSFLTLQLRDGSLAKTYENYNARLQAMKPLGAIGEPWRDPAIGMMALANSLQSLTSTLPLIAEGDASAYYESEIVANAQQIWTLTKAADPDTQALMRASAKMLSAQLIGELIAGLPQEVKKE